MSVERDKKIATPLVIVLTSLSIIEVAMTVMYPRMTTTWEKVPLLAVILLLPIAIVGTFIFLWIKKPGHLFPPSEFESGENTAATLRAYGCNDLREISDIVNELDHRNGEITPEQFHRLQKLVNTVKVPL